MKILITGGCGFIGANLAVWLQDRGHIVTCFDNLVRRGSERNIERVQKVGCQFQHGDIRNKEDLPREDFEVVLHTAAQPAACLYDHPEFDMMSNVFGTTNLLEWVRIRQCGMIFWSTNKVYPAEQINGIPTLERETRLEWITVKSIGPDQSIGGGDHSIYGVSKAMADLACQEYSDAYDLPIIINRFSCIYGPYQFGRSEQGWLAWFAFAIKHGWPITIYGYGGKQVRDILFIGDLCFLIELQLSVLNSLGGQVYNVGGGPGKTVSLLEAIALLEELLGRKAVLDFCTLPRRADHQIYISDIDLLQREYGWSPKVGVRSGLTRLCGWVMDTSISW